MTTREDAWAAHGREWRRPEDVIGLWRGAGEVDARVLGNRARGAFWETLEELGVTLLVTREYEHLVMALSVRDGRPVQSYLPMPHPSGIVATSAGRVRVASTRNPNQLIELRPAAPGEPRSDVKLDPPPGTPLVPVATRFYPGSLYLHDVVVVGGTLVGTATGTNSVVSLEEPMRAQPLWWPACVDGPDGPERSWNLIQLNSIAAGDSLEQSFFSASTDRPSTSRRPGQLNFPVDRRGVIFSGATREVVGRGLTRPHSARFVGRELWVADSGYGRLVAMRDGVPETVVDLPGWTRGVCVLDGVVAVATSRVISRFSAYAPGVEVDQSRCAVHLIAPGGERLGSIEWPDGNQIFGIEAIPSSAADCLPFHSPTGRDGRRVARLFYSLSTLDSEGET